MTVSPQGESGSCNRRQEIAAKVVPRNPNPISPLESISCANILLPSLHNSPKSLDKTIISELPIQEMQYHSLPHQDKWKGTAIDHGIVLQSPPGNVSELLPPEDDITVSTIKSSSDITVVLFNININLFL
jgi:hypothetical protein